MDLTVELLISFLLALGVYHVSHDNPSTDRHGFYNLRQQLDIAMMLAMLVTHAIGRLCKTPCEICLRFLQHEPSRSITHKSKGINNQIKIYLFMEHVSA